MSAPDIHSTQFTGVRVRAVSEKPYDELVAALFADIGSTPVPINDFPDPKSFEILRERNVRYVTLHLQTYSNPEAWKIMLERFPRYAEYVRPIVQEGNVWLYEIVKYP